MGDLLKNEGRFLMGFKGFTGGFLGVPLIRGSGGIE